MPLLRQKRHLSRLKTLPDTNQCRLMPSQRGPRWRWSGAFPGTWSLPAENIHWTQGDHSLWFATSLCNLKLKYHQFSLLDQGCYVLFDQSTYLYTTSLVGD